MKQQNYNVIGVMSGTSLDGIDLAHIHFSVSDAHWEFQMLHCQTVAYQKEWLDKLKTAVGFSKSELQQLNGEYTLLLGAVITDFIQKNGIHDLDAVCSHGHTILHQPHNGFTLQIGNLPEIATYVNETIVCDFRVQDVKLGGQGAPLVPIGDRLLFSEYDFCLNLGGFSNISFAENQQRLAFDISPVNTVLNFYANKLGLDFDDQGKIARLGKVDPDLLSQLNALDYYQRSYPKSLGFEFVKEIVLPLIEHFPISIEDKMHTFISHIAFQTAKALVVKKGKMLITGGGAYNIFLIEQLQSNLPEMTIVIPDPKVLEFKEALIFGLLGVLRLRNESNVLSSVTGAAMDHSSGNIFKP